MHTGIAKLKALRHPKPITALGPLGPGWPVTSGGLLPTQPAARNKVSMTSRGHPRLPAPLRTPENKALIAGTLDVPAESMFSGVPRPAVIVGK